MPRGSGITPILVDGVGKGRKPLPPDEQAKLAAIPGATSGARAYKLLTSENVPQILIDQTEESLDKTEQDRVKKHKEAIASIKAMTRKNDNDNVLEIYSSPPPNNNRGSMAKPMLVIDSDEDADKSPDYAPHKDTESSEDPSDDSSDSSSESSSDDASAKPKKRKLKAKVSDDESSNDKKKNKKKKKATKKRVAPDSDDDEDDTPPAKKKKRITKDKPAAKKNNANTKDKKPAVTAKQKGKQVDTEKPKKPALTESKASAKLVSARQSDIPPAKERKTHRIEKLGLRIYLLPSPAFTNSKQEPALIPEDINALLTGKSASLPTSLNPSFAPVYLNGLGTGCSVAIANALTQCRDIQEQHLALETAFKTESLAIARETLNLQRLTHSLPIIDYPPFPPPHAHSPQAPISRNIEDFLQSDSFASVTAQSFNMNAVASSSKIPVQEHNTEDLEKQLAMTNAFTKTLVQEK